MIVVVEIRIGTGILAVMVTVMVAMFSSDVFSEGCCDKRPY